MRCNMKKYFFIKSEQVSTVRISQYKVDLYKEQLIIEMKRLGAESEELSLISDSIIQNSILNGRKPEDVAWAILQ